MPSNMIPPAPALRCEVFEASGNFTVPAETVFVSMVGGGQAQTADGYKPGWSGVAIVRRRVSGLTVGDSVSVVVGASGVGFAGQIGGESSFGTFVSAPGGNQAIGAARAAAGGTLESGKSTVGGMFGGYGAGAAAGYSTSAAPGMVMIEW